jgi:hypothetical protein
MSGETGERSLDLAFRHPSPRFSASGGQDVFSPLAQLALDVLYHLPPPR